MAGDAERGRSDAGGRPPAPTGPGRGFSVITSAEDAAWTAVLAESAQYDFHHLAGYHRLAEAQGEGTALLFAYRDQGHLIALPLLVRPVDASDPDGPADATSVYGYGGPVASSPEVPVWAIRAFQEELHAELLRRRVVAVFSRLHPLIPQDHLLQGLGEVRAIGPTVSVDLTQPPDAQWAGYSKQCRRIVRRARETGVVCVHDELRAYRQEWADMYRETMERVKASSSYYFDAAYFERMAQELGPVLHLFVALLDGEVIAGGLFTICDGIVQAHLAALRSEFLSLSPARLIDDTARVWAWEQGAHTFHLGGGVGGRSDSLLLYKSGFSNRRHVAAVWRWVVDERVYRGLCERLAGAGLPEAASGDSDFFPAYRRPGSGRRAGSA